MPFDKNEAVLSGKIIKLDDVPTKSGIRMARLRLSCYKEQFSACAFKEIADQILDQYDVGSRVELTGKIQTSVWESDGVKRSSFQLNVSSFCADDDTGENCSKNGENQQNLYQGGPF